MGPSERPRRVVFAVVSLTLVASGIAFSGTNLGAGAGGEERQEATRAEPSALITQRVTAKLARLRGQVERAAQRFLTPFLRYEVGESDARVRRELRGASTARFASQLLANPPRPPAAGRFPPRARLDSLDVIFASGGTSSAVVSGAALRDGQPENFSFLFQYVQAGWRASGGAG
jgi:hypothetical protein